MTNVELEVKGSKLVITVDLTKDFGPSKSGKTTIVATTGGGVPVPGMAHVKVGVNVYKGR